MRIFDILCVVEIGQRRDQASSINNDAFILSINFCHAAMNVR